MIGAAAVQAYRCLTCGWLQLAANRCQQCRSAVAEVDVPSSGEVRAVTVLERVPPDVLCEPPYGVVVVRLDDGPELVVLSVASEAIAVGERVAVSRTEVSRDGESTGTFAARRLEPSTGGET